MLPVHSHVGFYHLMRVVQVHGEVWLLYPWLASFTGPKREKNRAAPLFLLCTKALQRGDAAPTSPRLDATQKVQLGSAEEEAAWTLRATMLHAFVWVRGRHARACIPCSAMDTQPISIYLYIYLVIYAYVSLSRWCSVWRVPSRRRHPLTPLPLLTCPCMV